ncbi:hypothetical protein K504DRAFT_492776 [Pleomassaria siparia CBS 279.74]|uniref:Protein artemis n=1 Tax=Pleomassaria siparia CBS 279.74 TaxID=1314801 RepID=A0A6G1K327_9PLEO|nr:hypothetical protein K504DRAFT_492776 [Pleomassaria siparia CBS 279.74]
MQILLRLEKYHYRLNLARGILESRNVTYDKSLRGLAKALPLETPTLIELDPKNKIRVTLFDANHCIGAVMFLIEGNGKAILYTGDIRAETWWVNSLVQNPVLLPYTLGSRRLDCIYLDTTFATKSEPYREFPSKAEGISELLQKVEQYPVDTKFYFHSWTFGYENVWIALSSFLNSQIHLDEYRARIYASLSTLDKTHLREAGLDVTKDNKFLRDSGLQVPEAPTLCGFKRGNHIQSGCLTSQFNVRLHSCERGMGCPIVDHDTDANMVHIIPIVARVNGTDLAEIGAGGGKGDLDQREELETADEGDVGKLMELCAKQIKDDELLSRVLVLLQPALNGGKINLGTALQKQSQDGEDRVSLQTLVSVLSTNAINVDDAVEKENETIRFPYSRHSSYSELCSLVKAFQPNDVFPCTVDEANWNPTLGMQPLFGSFCSSHIFRHDAEMMDMYEAREERTLKGKRPRQPSQEPLQTSEVHDAAFGVLATPKPPCPPNKTTVASTFEDEIDEIDEAEFYAPRETLVPTSRLVVKGKVHVPVTSPPLDDPRTHSSPNTTPPPQPPKPSPKPSSNSAPLSSPPHHPTHATPSITMHPSTTTIPSTCTNQNKTESRPRLNNKAIAYQAALGIGLTWADYGGLVSARRNSDTYEEEL